MPTPPLISLEEHFFAADVPAELQASYSEQLKHIPSVRSKLQSLADVRLGDMDAGGIALQVISHAPGLSSFPLAANQSANDQLSAAILSQQGQGSDHGQSQRRQRFAAFAALPMCDPAAAAAELERCMTKLGFVGALVDNHLSDGTFYDNPAAYEPFWAAAETLNAPVYLHPSWATEAQMACLYSPSTVPSSSSGVTSKSHPSQSFSQSAASSLSSSGLGWHATTALHVLRLHASGLFDRHPRLRLIIGHMGEMIPFMLARIQALSKRWGEFRRDFQTVYDENIWITTSGVWSIDPLRCILANTKPDHILYSVDYPFQNNEAGLAWMRELEASGLVDEEQLEAIAHGNAEKLLRVTAQR